MLADAVQTVFEPEPLAVTVVATPAAAHDGDELMADVPDRKQIHTAPVLQLLPFQLP